MKKAMYLLLPLLLSTLMGFAQMYEGNPCTSFTNPTLYSVFDKENSGEFVSISLNEFEYGGYETFSTSFLKPSGTAPPLPSDSPKALDADEEEEMLMANHAWTCMYSAHSLVDYDTKTAWVEGKSGYGAGEGVVIMNVDPREAVEIWAGYGKSVSLHNSNSRPRNVRVHVLQMGRCDAAQFGMVVEDLKVIGSRRVELKDLYGWQPLPMPTVFWDEMDTNCPYMIGIELVDAYPGEKWDDTCISEVRNAK